jgi:hypothetical protein
MNPRERGEEKKEEKNFHFSGIFQRGIAYDKIEAKERRIAWKRKTTARAHQELFLRS